VRVAVGVAQLVGNSIQEQVPSLNMTRYTCEISCFYHSADEEFSVLVCYVTEVSTWLPTFHDNLLLPSTWLKLSLDCLTPEE